MKTLHVFLFAVTAALSIGVGAERLAPAAASSPPPSPADPVAAGSGFYVDVPKWNAPDRGKNVELVADYTWGAQPARIASASDGGTYWRLLFPDRPGTTDVAKLRLTYAFDLTPQDRDSINKITDSVVRATIDVAVAALGAGPAGSAAFDAAVKSTIDSVVAKAKPLATFTDATGHDSASLLLRDLGLVQQDDGSWTVSADTLLTLRPLAAAQTLAPATSSRRASRRSTTRSTRQRRRWHLAFARRRCTRNARNPAMPRRRWPSVRTRW